MKRQSHYFFAYQRLRQIALSDPATFQNIMQSAGATQFLADIYHEVKSRYNDHVDIAVSSNDFEVSVFEAGEQRVIIITLPEPIIAPEAKFIAIILPAEIDDPAPSDVRYLTLERADNREQNASFMHGEWVGTDTHQNYRTAESADIEAFMEWVRTEIKS